MIPLVGISPLLIVSPFDFSDRPFDSPNFRSKALNQFAGHMDELTTTLELGISFDLREHSTQMFLHLA
jgi:hypothetical protein